MPLDFGAPLRCNAPRQCGLGQGAHGVATCGNGAERVGRAKSAATASNPEQTASPKSRVRYPKKPKGTSAEAQ